MTCRGPPAAAFAFIRQSSVFRPCCPALKSWWWLGLPRGGGRTSPAGSRLPPSTSAIGHGGWNQVIHHVGQTDLPGYASEKRRRLDELMSVSSAETA